MVIFQYAKINHTEIAKGKQRPATIFDKQKDKK
jgi:hypothetical protein